MGFKFLEDVAIADIAFSAEGKTREELFENCSLALTTAMADTGKISGKVKKKITVGGKNDDELLYNFLSELVYIKDVEGLLFKKFRISFGKADGEDKKKRAASGTISMSAECTGDSLESIGRGNLNNDVKAITMYKFGVKKEKGKWVATVVVDI